MPLTVLRSDALSIGARGFELRVSLPWIRSLPVWSVLDPTVRIDGAGRDVRVARGARTIAPEALGEERGWWFMQDRLVLRGTAALAPGSHDVTVAFGLVIPYLPAGPDAPLRLPFTASRTLIPGPPADGVSRDVA